ncbi:MAG TPA: MMPL family transporter [Candidatus Binatia bacterium]|nr:MMPL family transporter [Candidatus Binatia bacterium]
MRPLGEWVARRPWWTVIAVLLLSVAAALTCFDPGTGRLRIELDPSTDRLLPAASADRVVYQRLRRTFGDSDAILVAVGFDPVFTAEHVAKIAALSDRFGELPGVTRVFSLATAPNLVADGDSVDVASFAAQAAAHPERIAQLPAQLAANPIYKGVLVSDDGRVASFALSMSDVDDAAFLDTGYGERIRRIVREVAGDAPVWITGGPVVKAATTGALLHTLRRLVPAIFLVMAAVLYVAFRSLRAMLVSVVAIGIALLWTMATAVAFGLQLNLVTVIVPPLVLTLGFTYAIHVLSEYLKPESAKGRFGAALARAARPLGRSRAGLALRAVADFFGAARSDSERIAQTLQRIAMPVGMSFATTLLGFLAFVPNPLPAIQQFGWLSVAGVGYTALLALLFVPAALAVMGSTVRRELPGEAWFRRLTGVLAEFDLRRRTAVLVIGLGLIPAGFWLSTQVRAGTEYIRDFPRQSEVRRDYEAINRAFNGANVVSILVETHVTDALTDPGLAREIAQLQEWLRAQPEIGSAVSYVDFLKLTHQSLDGGAAGAFVVPAQAETIKQLLVFAGNDELRRFIDARMATAQVLVRINVDGSRPIHDLVERIEERLAQLPPPLSARVTGGAVLATRTVGDIVSGQAQSVIIGAAAIWLLMSMLFTSVRAGLLAMLPTLIPVAVYFGALALFRIDLSPTTSLIATIVLGITVDESFHFLARFNTVAREKASEQAALKQALGDMIRPVTLNTVALCLGFLAFVFGELHNQAQFGLLAAFTLLMAWVADLTVLPALGSLMRIVTLWDMLQLDLGRSPQHTIPMFSGLSLRQARLFALLSKLESHPAGARVIREGDWSRDMYVIVDGELEAWVDRDGERRPLATMGRGATMGEGGFFGQRRTANVDTLSPARLLRFDSQDLERLRERYPKIAATVFRNINRIQAERLARMTAMLQ